MTIIFFRKYHSASNILSSKFLVRSVRPGASRASVLMRVSMPATAQVGCGGHSILKEIQECYIKMILVLFFFLHHANSCHCRNLELRVCLQTAIFMKINIRLIKSTGM